MKIAIIGGEGRMGKFLAKQFTTGSKATEIISIDKGDSLELILGSDIVVLAAPLSVIPSLVQNLKKSVEKNQLVFDIGAIKKKIIPELESLKCQVASCHPLFGSYIQSFKGQNLALITDIGTPGSQKTVRELFKGANITTLTAKEHDKAMIYSLCLPFILRKVFGIVNKAELVSGAETQSYRIFEDYLAALSKDSRETIVVQEILEANKEGVDEIIGAIDKALSTIKSELEG